jgi:SIT4 phosphatase-associated protein
MLRLFASRINDFQRLLAKPKSVPSSIVTTFGQIEPLGFERFRICELYAELLHCSNMVLLNDTRGEEVVQERDIERERLRKEGRRKPHPVDIWGDTDLRNGKPWDTETFSSDGSDKGDLKEEMDPATPGLSNGSPYHGNAEGSHEDIPAESSSDINNPMPEDVKRAKDTSGRPAEESEMDIMYPETSSNIISAEDDLPNTSKRIQNDRTKDEKELGGKELPGSSPPETRPVVGDYLKMQFVDAMVLPSVVDLFFTHPWNNFLHNVVYDILTQVLNGPMDKGFNRQLAVDLFTTGQLTEKILQGQKVSDEAQ